MSKLEKEQQIENGGANAQRGFNYQDAIATLIIISNYTKNNFCIYLECRDDIEVNIDSHKIFIQVKATKQSINGLTKTTKKQGKIVKSTLHKNLEKNSSKSSRYKIVTTEYTNACSSTQGMVFNEIYEYSEEEKKIITEKLEEQGLDKALIQEKLNNSFIYVSPFDDNLENACIFLQGLMSKNNISVDNGKGELLLNEIFHEIHLKSEKKVINELDIEKKKIKKEDLKKLFKVESCYKHMEDIINKLENKEVISFIDKLEITEKYIRKIDLQHKSERKQVENIITKVIDTGNPELDIKKAYDKISEKLEIKSTLLYAILIDKFVMEAINL